MLDEATKELRIFFFFHLTVAGLLRKTYATSKTQMTNRVKNKRYRQYRGAVLAQGFHSLSAWAKSRNYPPTTVYTAARGERPNGNVSQKIINELEGLLHA